MMRLISSMFAKSKTNELALVKSESRNPSSSWANLPTDLLHSIAERLDVSSSARLSVVCPSWTDTINAYLGSFAPFNLNQPIPLLLLSAQDSKPDSNCTDLTFYDLTTNRSYSIPISIPSIHDHHWLGCNKGWLMTLDPQSQIHLIKPHTGAHLLLPSIGTEDQPRKVILHRTPDCTYDYFALGLSKCRQKLVFITPGAKRWALQPLRFQPTLDVALYKGKYYSLSSVFLHCWGFQGSSITLEASIHLPARSWGRNLLNWRGALLVLCTTKKPRNAPQNSAYQVKLYKVNERDHNTRSCITSLRDDAMFVSNNHAYAVTTSGADNVHKNCVYFTDHLRHPIHPFGSIQLKCYFGVYDLLMGTWKCKSCSPPDSHTHQYPPIWFRPY